MNTGQLNGHEWVDLGLPSGVKWATCNIGASCPEEYGDYFAWGDARIKGQYSWETYKYYSGRARNRNLPKFLLPRIKLSKYNSHSNNGMVDNLNSLAASDDPANELWGSGWRLPRRADFEELQSLCKIEWEWNRDNKANGVTITGPNGNSIFLPAAGVYEDDLFLGTLARDEGGYWSSNLAFDSTKALTLRIYCLEPYLTISGLDEGYPRCYGLTIRPVTK